MTDPTAISQANSIEEVSDLGSGDAGLWAYWMGQEAIAERAEEDWIKRGDVIVKRYRDERSNATPDGQQASKMNILWSNVETLMPTLYARTPKPDVDRRWKDGMTPTARLAALLLQRCLTFACDTSGFDDVMKPAVKDKLLPGRGVARVLYVPHFGDVIPETPAAGAQPGDATAAPSAAATPPETLGSAQTEADEREANDDSADDDAIIDAPGDEKSKGDQPREVVYEEVVPRYVYWKDYREGPARQWCEVPWIRYRSYLTRDELKKRFGNKKAQLVTLDYTPEGHTQSDKDKTPPDLFKKAVVHEYWDKGERRVVWLAPLTPDLILDEEDDPLGLPEFFPNPDPLLATTTTDTRIPVPDYAEYQDQARKIDKLTARIDKLTDALKVIGVYPGEEKQTLSQLFDAGDTRLVPVHDWANWSDKGGLAGFIEWIPIKQVAEVLIQLYDARDREKAILYEITGIGDIMRGMTSPDETLGAQELKSVFATRRITPQQKRVAAFARDLLRLMSGIIAGHFSDKTISTITGYPQLVPVPQLPPKPQPSASVQFEIQLYQQWQQGQQQAQQQQSQAGAPGASSSPAAPQGGNAVPPAPSRGAGAGVAPGGPPQQQQPPQPPQPPPLSQEAQQFAQQTAQWQQQAQQVQALQGENQKRQAAFAEACQLIREDGVHGFKIDIEADSTIAPDEQAEKAARTEFLGKFVPLMENVIPLAQGNPALAALAKEIALFGVRGFPVARSLEETIEEAFDAIAKMPPQPAAGAGKAAGKQGPTPQELAVKKNSDDVKLQIARENNMEKMANQEQDLRADMIKAEVQQEHDRSELALKVGRGAKQDALAAARLTHIEGRNAEGLT
jgi:hypothetical protein